MIEWQRSRPEPGQDYPDIPYDSAEGIAKITINRPEARHAFRPTTQFGFSHAFNAARHDPETGVIILTGPGEKAQKRRNAPQQKRNPDYARSPRHP